MEFEHKPTGKILKHFEEISKIPRCSKNEEKLAQWLSDWAESNGFQSKMDNAGSLLIKVPSTPGYENSPVVVIQGHMDMVCEKTPDSDHDFTSDPIKFVFDGEWLTADKTTLGADNGIAIAMAMEIALDKEVKHPPLELLFTVDEETGLTGANELEPGFIEGKILINVDSEDEGVFTVGCAGGINTNIILPIKKEAIPGQYSQFKITAGGMKGGHSGIDIDKQKANAIQVLGRTLFKIRSHNIDLRIASISGGSAHNAIPRDAETTVFFPSEAEDRVSELIAEMDAIFKIEFNNTDPDIIVAIEKSNEAFSQILTDGTSALAIDFIFAIPHGVAVMSADIKDLVETSNNFANINLENENLTILTSQRSSVMSRLHAITNKIEAVARIGGGKAHSGDGYPPWQPNMESPLLAKSLELYKKMYNKEPIVEVIHAGLECGIIGDKYPGMDMISIGPTLKYPHSPDEKIHIGTIGQVWDFICELLAETK